MLAGVRQQQLEGVIGKRKDSLYQPGKRTGAWIKYRVNRGQELVIGGYIPGPHGFDSLVVDYYRGKDLVYVARVRNGFVPASRRQVFEKRLTHSFWLAPCRRGEEDSRNRYPQGNTIDPIPQCLLCSADLRRAEDD